MEGVIRAVLDRPEALGIVAPAYRVIRHPEKDPGVLRRGPELVADSLAGERDVLVLMDRDGSGAATESAREIERDLETRLGKRVPGGRRRAVVIEPELDVWMWATEAAMRTALEWTRPGGIRDWAAAHLGTDFDERGKPVRTDATTGPKEVLEGVLRAIGIPRSGSLYRQIAGTTSLKNCADPAFVRLRDTLRAWYGFDSGASA